MFESVEEYEAVFRNNEDKEGNRFVGRQGVGQARGNINRAAEELLGKKMTRCSTSVQWWDEVREAIKERREIRKKHTRVMSW